MPVMLDIDINVIPTEGLLEGHPVGTNVNLMIPDQLVGFQSSTRGGGRRADRVSMKLTSNTSQLIDEDYSDAFITVNAMRARIR